jgi:hypothetical protein
MLGILVYGQDRLEKHREQASLVSAWFTAKSHQSGPDDEPTVKVTIHVSNRSEQPVYNVTIWSLREAAERLRLPVLPPSFEHAEEAQTAMMAEDDQYAANVTMRYTDARGLALGSHARQIAPSVLVQFKQGARCVRGVSLQQFITWGKSVGERGTGRGWPLRAFQGKNDPLPPGERQGA